MDLVVDAVEDTGSVAYLHATARVGGGSAPLVVRLPGRATQGKGARVRVGVRADVVHCFSAATGLRLDEPAAVRTVPATAPEDAVPPDAAARHAPGAEAASA
ncbi:hypothetical protein M8J74_16355 [Streptomyces panaciradicis]|nr:hypothetical protein [Streptomyces panaciradicis]